MRYPGGRRNRLRRLWSFGLLSILLLLPAGVHAALPPEVVARIAAAAQSAKILAAEEAAVGRALGQKSLQWIQARRARDSGNSALGVAVASAIASHPNLTAEIVSTAVAASPSSRQAIARHAVRSYPGFASVISQASGVPLSQLRTGVTPYQSATILPTYQTVPAYQTRPAAPLRRYPTAPVYPQPVYPQVTAPAPTPSPQTTELVEGSDADEEASPTGGAEEISDPLEGINRAIFVFNDAIDTMVLKPIAALYGFLMPIQAKAGAQRFFANLNEPLVAVNDAIQLDGSDAAVSLGRFAVNSTVGVLGIFDVAEDFGLEKHHADFGQTLHSYGLGPGPYLVLPLLGPSTLRDGTGQVVDSYADPISYLLNRDLKIARAVGETIVGREQLIAPLDTLRSSSVDYYAALRAAYYQNRVSDLNKGRGGGTSQEAVDDLFDSAE